MDAKEKERIVEIMDDMINRDNLSVDEELSSLGGMLYAAVIKRILNDEWQEGYVEFLENMRDTLLADNGEIDEKSCLVELSAAQISGPALENEYNKTFDAVDLAGNILDVDTSKLNTPEYISKGRELAESFKKFPKKILIAAIVGGILFCGQPGSPVLIGPKAAEASSLLGAVFSILASQVDVSFSNGAFDVSYDAENAGERIAKYAAREATYAIASGIENLPDRLEKSKKESNTEAYNLLKKMDQNSVKFNADEKVTILKGIYMLNEFNGLSPDELVLCMLMLSPSLSNQRLSDVCSFMAKNADTSNGKINFNVMEGSGALSVLEKSVEDFDKDEVMTGFLANTVKVSERLVRNDKNSKNIESLNKLLDTTYWSVRRYYNNPTLTNMAKKTLDRQLGKDIQSVSVDAIVGERPSEADTSL